MTKLLIAGVMLLTLLLTPLPNAEANNEYTEDYAIERTPIKLSIYEKSDRRWNEIQRECLTWHIYSEAGNDKEWGKISVGAFLISEAEKSGMSLCGESKSRKDGGAYKYSWHYHERYYKKRAKTNHLERQSYAQSERVANMLLNADEEENNHYKKQTMVYDHYIAKDLARTNPPSWFKNHIVKYKVVGKTVFAKLDFSINDRTMFRKLTSELRMI